MQGVAKFVTKAYPVSGSLDYLSEVSTQSVRVCAPVSLVGVPHETSPGEQRVPLPPLWKRTGCWEEPAVGTEQKLDKKPGVLVLRSAGVVTSCEHGQALGTC